MSHEIKIVAAVLANIRGEISMDCIAYSFGVTDLQVQEWKDVFQVAGPVALMNALKPDANGDESLDMGPAMVLGASRFAASEPTTFPPG